MLAILAACLLAPDSQALVELRKVLPNPGQVLFDGQLQPGAQDGLATWTEVAASGAPFERCLRVEVKQPGPNSWAVQASSPGLTEFVKKGDTLLASVWVRRVGDDPAIVSGHLQGPAPAWEQIGYGSLLPGRSWKRVLWAGPAPRDFQPGEITFSLHLAQRKQTLELGGWVIVNLGQGITADQIPPNQIDYDGREADAPWRKEAAKRIDRYRKGTVQVRVLDGAGNPVTNAEVRVEQVKQEFEFGTFVEQPLLWQNEEGERYRDWIRRCYNKLTLPWYWADWGWEYQETRDFYFAAADWARAEGIPTKAHVLVYPGWQFLPGKLRELQGDPAAMRKMIEDHARLKLEQTRKYGFVSWDVTNELRDLKDLTNILGEEWHAELFKLAHEVDPKPTLYLNENTILTNGGFTTVQQDEYERQIRFLLERGAPLQGIGMQGHFGEALTPAEEVWRILDRFGKFNLPIQITEYDLPTRDEETQGEYTRDFLTMCMAHPSVTGFTMWGFWESSMWQPLGALVRKDWSLYPAGQAWEKAVTQTFRTDETLRTDRRGQASVRAFRGVVAVTCRGARAEVELGARGAQITIRVN